MKRCVLICALALAAVAAVAAQAEGGRPLPWEGGATVVTESERLFGQAASELAGRPVQVRCNGETDWAQLAAERGFTAQVWGYVSFLGNTPKDFAELSPVACWHLDQYAYTSPKPAYWCKGTETVTEWVQRQKRVRVREPLLRNGRPVVRKGKRVFVWKVRLVTTNVAVRRAREIVAKCPDADDWWRHIFALQTLAHESYHLKGVWDEAETECFGLQAVARTAAALGASEAEAKQAVDYDWTALYPRWQNTEYWSAECRSGGTLDLTPGDGLWP